MAPLLHTVPAGLCSSTPFPPWPDGACPVPAPSPRVTPHVLQRDRPARPATRTRAAGAILTCQSLEDRLGSALTLPWELLPQAAVPHPVLLPLFVILTVGGLHLSWLQLPKPSACHLAAHLAAHLAIFRGPWEARAASPEPAIPAKGRGICICPSGHESFFPTRCFNPVNTILISHSGLHCSLVSVAAIRKQPVCPITEGVKG